MKLVMPVAGFGTRMRPHTWTRPKSLLPIAGKPMLAYVLDLFNTLNIEEVILTYGWLGEQIIEFIENNYSTQFKFIEQKEILGQAHAFWLAHEHLTGPIFTFFPDTLFYNVDFSILDDPEIDGIVFVKEVEDPRRFGVTVVDSNGRIEKLVEKPDSMENKRAMIGLYYFKDGAWFARACKEIIDQDVKTKGEYFQADAVNIMIEEGAVLKTSPVIDWLDTGTPPTTLETHRYLLENGHANNQDIEHFKNSVLVPPVFIHPSAKIENSIIGPYTSVHQGAEIKDSIIRDSIIDDESVIESLMLTDSLIGRWAEIHGTFRNLNIGDSSQEKN